MSGLPPGQFLLTASFLVYGLHLLVIPLLPHKFLWTADQFKYCDGAVLETVFPSSQGVWSLVIVFAAAAICLFSGIFEPILSSLHPCPTWLPKPLLLTHGCP